MANSSFSLTITDAFVYSSFKARTMHPRISSKFGNLAISLFKQSCVVLPYDTSSGISVKPVKSRALAKNNTFIWIEDSLLSTSAESEFPVLVSLSVTSIVEPGHGSMEMHHLTAIITQLYQFESDDTYSKFQSLKLIQSLTMIEIEPIYKDWINFLKNTQFSTQDLIKNQKKKKEKTMKKMPPVYIVIHSIA